jgi:hypothetical protein
MAILAPCFKDRLNAEPIVLLEDYLDHHSPIELAKYNAKYRAKVATFRLSGSLASIRMGPTEALPARTGEAAHNQTRGASKATIGAKDGPRKANIAQELTIKKPNAKTRTRSSTRGLIIVFAWYPALLLTHLKPDCP